MIFKFTLHNHWYASGISTYGLFPYVFMRTGQCARFPDLEFVAKIPSEEVPLKKTFDAKVC